jgi:hypothetical protein
VAVQSVKVPNRFWRISSKLRFEDRNAAMIYHRFRVEPHNYYGVGLKILSGKDFPTPADIVL